MVTCRQNGISVIKTQERNSVSEHMRSSTVRQYRLTGGIKMLSACPFSVRLSVRSFVRLLPTSEV